MLPDVVRRQRMLAYQSLLILSKASRQCPCAMPSFKKFVQLDRKESILLVRHTWYGQEEES